MGQPNDIAATADSGRGQPIGATTDLGTSQLSDTIDHGRFVPGAVVGGRYRIVELLGKGGMGEVYRADDLKLAQPVALKFLPPKLAEHPGRVARFHNEVRIARQVSHANVCRVYDIGEVDGQPFISMEYVDGENLASLLLRIDRLPGDKAVQIARQLCAGLAAAHDRNVLHRDLKPANVMLDGRGRVRITDFGLAGLAEEMRGAEIRAGTPAYMSPEQLGGREVTARSDIYSLGLVLYEIFTGKAAFQASSLSELMQVRDDSNPSSPSTHVSDLDPAVERIILRCLERDPRNRPQSALAVAAALPGANPLAAALAAGETPSPELVAAAGISGAIRPLHALIGAALVVLGLLGTLLAAESTFLVNRAGMDKRPEVLAEKAHEVLARLGYDQPSQDSAFGFRVDRDRLSQVTQSDSRPERWNDLGRRPGAVHFWFRQSPRYLVPADPIFSLGMVSPHDPPQLVSDMATVWLDPQGRLIEFEAVPMQREPATITSVAPDWDALLTAAGLDPRTLRETQPTWIPPVYADRRAAWEGTLPERSDLPIRVEAAACRGRPVYFQVVWPWTRPAQQELRAQSIAEKVVNALAFGLFVLVFPAGLWMARRNLRLGRGDRRGALRCALFVFCMRLLSWLLIASHVPEFRSELILFVSALAHAMYLGVVVWVFYVAIEPYVRRLWPDTIIAWSRVLNGQWGDPLVGRDVLIGVLTGIGYVLISQLGLLLPQWLNVPGAAPLTNDGSVADGVRAVAADLVTLAPFATFAAMFQMVLFLALRVLLGRSWRAAVIFVVLVATMHTLSGGNVFVDIPLGLITSVIAVLVILRCGLLALMISTYVQFVLIAFPLTINLSAWYFGASAAAVVAVLALAGYGVRAALAGRPLWNVRFAGE